MRNTSVLSCAPRAFAGLAGLALIMLPSMLGGCAKNDPLATDFKSVTDNLTPELQTLTERPVDVDANIAVTSNANLRMFWMDLGRAFYLDRPSGLSPYHLPPMSGQPR
ncbi:MAG: hypothetical protein SGJ09_09590 [Phycisphaerae bacterium]|nr:hypothetical protein [Phycisphaerae bacterium]